MSMSKAEELIRVVREQIAYSTEDNSREPLDALIQAVRDEEFEKHEATQPIGNDACMARWCGDCDRCPAKGTRYCP